MSALQNVHRHVEYHNIEAQFIQVNDCAQPSRLHSWFGQRRLSQNGDARFDEELLVYEISAHG